MANLHIGVDNGTTGSIGLISSEGYALMVKTPIKKEQSYTKKKQNISRIDSPKLLRFLEDHIVQYDHVRAAIERPMVNPARFRSTLSAIRALEATLNVFEILSIGYEYLDSKYFQKALLPEGTEGTAELKKASAQVGIRLYPSQAEIINKQKDADGLLIAHWLMLKYTQS